MTATGKSLMQMERERRKSFTKVVQLIAGVPVIGLGVLLLHLGYSKPDYVYLFLYFALGLSLMLFGFVMIISGIPSGKKKITISKPEEAAEVPVGPAGKCPKCNADIMSAGKFCGNCGSLLDAPDRSAEQ